MIFKRFSLHRKKPELCNICEQEMLKSNFFSKKNFFETLVWNTYTGLVVSFLLQNNLIHKVWVDLINKRQHRTQCFLGKMSESHGINLFRGQ